MKLVHRLQLAMILPAFAPLLLVPPMRLIVDLTADWPFWWLPVAVLAFDAVSFSVVMWLTRARP